MKVAQVLSRSFLNEGIGRKQDGFVMGWSTQEEEICRLVQDICLALPRLLYLYVKHLCIISSIFSMTYVKLCQNHLHVYICKLYICKVATKRPQLFLFRLFPSTELMLFKPNIWETINFEAFLGYFLLHCQFYLTI